MNYRKEIDGLRAIAVIPVILFHAGITGFQGGFLGVDIFFVISGYLITTLIIGQLKQRSFSLKAFYIKRARRILPALFLVTAACIPIAWFLMLPDNLENFGQSVVATVAFSNNILLNLTAGYWVQASEFKPLIHTWSLGVEEQYYLVIPLLLLGLYRLNPRSPALALALLAIVSLLWSDYAASRYLSANFYLLFSRFWELAIGGLAGLLVTRIPVRNPFNYKAWLAGLGLLLILLSISLFNRHIPHPGLATLPVVIGTVLILSFAQTSTPVGKLLASPLFTGIGLISYSAYLWHQPIFAFTRLSSLEPPGQAMMLGLIPFILLLSWASWRFVEMPFRHPSSIPNRRFGLTMGITAASLISIGLFFHATSGLMQSSPELSDGKSYGLKQNSAYNESAIKYSADAFPENQRTNVLVIGKSFARDFINAGMENNYFSQHNIVYRSDFNICDTRMEKLSATNSALISSSQVIIFVFRSNGFNPDCMLGSIATLPSLTSARIIVVGTKNFGTNNDAVMLLPKDVRYQYRAAVKEDELRANSKAARKIPATYYVDIMQMLMDSEGKVPVFTPDRKFISQDTEHLTRAGAKYIGKIIFEHPLLQSIR